MSWTITPEQLLGTSTSLPPDIMALLTEVTEENIPVSADLGAERRKMAKEALRPFAELPDGQRVRTLLAELAVIQDTRLSLEVPSYMPWQPLARPHYFTSAIVSYVEPQNRPLVLQAWHAAIGELAKLAQQDVARGGSGRAYQMIVPHEQLYDVAAFIEGVPGLQLADRTAKLPPESTEFAAHLSRYRYPPASSDETNLPVADSIKHLLGCFVANVNSSVQQSNRENPKRDVLRYIIGSKLLVVPFKRRRLSQQGEGTEPAGCLFLLLGGLGGEEESENALKDIALRANCLLSQASLKEAHAELEVRNRVQMQVAAVAHFLPTILGSMQFELSRTRETAKKPEVPDAVRCSLQRAIEYSKQLDNAVAFALGAWKASTKLKEYKLETESAPEEFVSNLKRVVRDCWNEVKTFLETRSQSNRIMLGTKEVRAGSCLDIDDSSWLKWDVGSGATVKWDEEYVRAVCRDAILNSQAHGTTGGIVQIRLNPTSETDAAHQHTAPENRYVWIEIVNRIPPDGISRAIRAIENKDDRFGFVVPYLAAKTYLLPTPQHAVKEDLFIARLCIGEMSLESCGSEPQKSRGKGPLMPITSLGR